MLYVSDILHSINNTLSGLDPIIALIEVLHKEFQSLRTSLEFSQKQLTTLTKENYSLRQSVTSITNQLTSVIKENKDMKETILDLQSRSMRDIVFFWHPRAYAGRESRTVNLGLHDHSPQNYPGHCCQYYFPPSTPHRTKKSRKQTTTSHYHKV